MLAQYKRQPQSKYILFTSQPLPETISTLLSKIDAQQSRLHQLLGSPLELPHANVSNSFEIFLDEMKDKVQAFILNFDELAMQMFPIKLDAKFKSENIHPLPSKDALTLLQEIFTITSSLSEMFSSLELRFKKTDTQNFFKDLTHKSLIFYKQSHVVLKSYLRIYMAECAK